MNVRRFLGLAPLIVAAIPVASLARDCNEVKAEIDAKIKAKGVTNYALQIVNGPDVKEGQIVGNCDVGAKRIVYFRLGDPSASKILATEKALKDKLAEQSPSDDGKSTAGSVFVTLLGQPCVVGNWTGTPRC
jgi:Protein of unknown function (DUF1161)